MCVCESVSVRACVCYRERESSRHVHRHSEFVVLKSKKGHLMWCVEPQTAFKGVVHPQNDIFSIDYLCLGHLGSTVFSFCICRIPKTKEMFR